MICVCSSVDCRCGAKNRSTSNEKKPREWTIFMDHAYPKGQAPSGYWRSTKIDVIEYSAYEQVVKERDDLKAELADTREGLTVAYMIGAERAWEKELKFERAKLSKLIERLKTIPAMDIYEGMRELGSAIAEYESTHACAVCNKMVRKGHSHTLEEIEAYHSIIKSGDET